MSLTSIYACSHAGLLVTREALANRAQAEAVRSAFDEVRRELAEDGPDALVVVATDHRRAYTWKHIPQIIVGVSPSAHGLGDGGLPAVDIPIHQRAAQHVLDSLIDSGIDASYSESMNIDHSFVMPLSWITPAYDMPIVPIALNCGAPPLISLQRCRDIGRVLGAAMRGTTDLSYAALATGGLSHWVGSDEWRSFLNAPAGTRLARQDSLKLEIGETGPINRDFDAEFLTSLEDGSLDEFLSKWPSQKIVEEAGNGAQEIRTWLVAAGLAAPGCAKVLCYEPVPEWLTGTAVARFGTAAEEAQ